MRAVKITTGKKAVPRRVMLYGTHGIGKSSWAAQAPGVLFLNVEDGLNDID
ncbi:MAG: AAA family ATPase, partial [Planctomyces sp.]